jgi:hypothetical protein
MKNQSIAKNKNFIRTFHRSSNNFAINIFNQIPTPLYNKINLKIKKSKRWRVLA